MKDAPAAQLADAIRRCLGGQRVFDPNLAAAALSEGVNPLTTRECEVLAAARQHPTVAAVAAAMYLSPGTVRNHLSSAITKLGAHNRSDAIRIAERKGLAQLRAW